MSAGQILVVGGAGYIGSHAVRALRKQGDIPIIFDNLSTGHRGAISGEKFFWGDVRNPLDLDRVFREHQICAVMHFCAKSLVGESMQCPEIYFENNVVGGLNLLQAMLRHRVPSIIFSSTAATFGQPEEMPIRETTPQSPTNPYGESKLIFEKMLHWYDECHGIKSVTLRYFNAAGADDKGDIGEDHSPETHLIPIIAQVLSGKREKLQVFGGDYPTPDGTCIRDYIHINDLARAHLLALKFLLNEKTSMDFNLGNGVGYSVSEIIRTVQSVAGKPVAHEISDRRAGDPAMLIASSERIQKILGWKPQYHLSDIISTALNWHSLHPDGYEKQECAPS